MGPHLLSPIYISVIIAGNVTLRILDIARSVIVQILGVTENKVPIFVFL